MHLQWKVCEEGDTKSAWWIVTLKRPRTSQVKGFLVGSCWTNHDQYRRTFLMSSKCIPNWKHSHQLATPSPPQSLIWCSKLSEFAGQNLILSQSSISYPRWRCHPTRIRSGRAELRRLLIWKGVCWRKSQLAAASPIPERSVMVGYDILTNLLSRAIIIRFFPKPTFIAYCPSLSPRQSSSSFVSLHIPQSAPLSFVLSHKAPSLTPCSPSHSNGTRSILAGTWESCLKVNYPAGWITTVGPG